MKRLPIDPSVIMPRSKARRGAAFLLLVAVMALVVLGATTSLVQNEVQSRRGTRQWIRSQVMLAAVEQARRMDDAGALAWSLPVSDDAEEFLEVSKGDASSEIVVRWIRRGDVIDQMIRSVAAAPNESERNE